MPRIGAATGRPPGGNNNPPAAVKQHRNTSWIWTARTRCHCRAQHEDTRSARRDRQSALVSCPQPWTPQRAYLRSCDCYGLIKHLIRTINQNSQGLDRDYFPNRCSRLHCRLGQHHAGWLQRAAHWSALQHSGRWQRPPVHICTATPCHTQQGHPATPPLQARTGRSWPSTQHTSDFQGFFHGDG